MSRGVQDSQVQHVYPPKTVRVQQRRNVRNPKGAPRKNLKPNACDYLLYIKIQASIKIQANPGNPHASHA